MRIVAICAHPDDETLGCGGTLLKHRAQGDEIHWIIVTAPRDSSFDDDYVRRRRQQIAAVRDAFGMSSVHELELPVTRLDGMALSEVIAPLARALETIAPDRAYVVNRTDVHSDHRVVFDASWAAMKPFPARRVVDIFCYETISSTNMAAPASVDFTPNCYSDITEVMQRKLQIFSLFETELMPSPYPRSLRAIEALAAYRGCAIGTEYAEAFEVLRKVW